MASITTLVGTDGITNANSMTKINTNFANLNDDKIETSYLDTDTTLAANSDTKIATQKAVKAYVDSGGNVNASETSKGIVEEATDAEVAAGTATGATGAKLFITPAKLQTLLTSSGTTPVINTYATTSTFLGDSTTQFDITNPNATTFRFTFDGTGTDPSITSSNPATGAGVNIQGQNFSSGNKGSYVVTASGTNYFEVSIATGGVAENNKTIGTGYIAIGTKWTKPAGLKYIVVEVVGGGGGGYAQQNSSSGSTAGKLSSFGSHLYATGGNPGTTGAGSGVNGDLNTVGQSGSRGFGTSSNGGFAGSGGSSYFGGGGTPGASNSGGGGDNYGGGGGGGDSGSSAQSGGNGGCAGGYSRKKVANSSLSSVEVAVIGSGGSGASASPSYAGGNGGGGVVVVTEYYV